MKAVHLAVEGAFLRYVEIPGADPPLIWLHGWQCSSTGELLPAATRRPYVAADRFSKTVVVDPTARYYGAALATRSLVTPD